MVNVAKGISVVNRRTVQEGAGKGELGHVIKVTETPNLATTILIYFVQSNYADRPCR